MNYGVQCWYMLLGDGRASTTVSCHSSQEGDHVGVCRRGDGTLMISVNGVDQGVAATNVPASVYGVIDIYGQAAQVTIVDQSGNRMGLLLERFFSVTKIIINLKSCVLWVEKVIY